MRPTLRPARWEHAAGYRTLLMGGALVVLASRMPFLGPGYGLDGDAWLTAEAAARIAATGQYVMSRVPGHPLQELTYSAIWDWGPLAFNIISAFMSVLAFVAFALTARRLRTHDYVAAGLALVFVPVIYLASTSAMDYVWALAFLMLSLYCVTAGRPVAAGVLLGAAAGCRLTSVVLIAPYVLMLPGPWRTAARVRAAVQLTVPAVLVTGLCYLPVWLAYRSGMPEVFDAAQLPAIILKRATVDLWGLAGIMALTVISGIAVWRWVFKPGRAAAQEFAVTPDRAVVAGWALAIAAIGCVYLSLPHEAGYLIPALPFVLLLLARGLSRPLFIGLCAALMISPFVFGVYTPGRPNSPQPSPLAFASPVNRSLQIDPLLGPITADHSARAKAAAFADRVIRASEGLPAHSVVAVGDWLPWVTLSLPPGQAWPKFVSVLGPTELANRLRAGWQVYYVPGTNARMVATVPLPADLADRAPKPLFE
jgi:hypothetical protein